MGAPYGALPAQYPAGGASSTDQYVMRATVSTGGGGNVAPVAVDDAYSTLKDTALTVSAPGVLANDSDANGDPLTAALVSGPAHGTLTLNNNGSFTYTPASGYTGSDAFSYRANDGKANSSPATVAITITGQVAATFGLNSGNNLWHEPPNYLEVMRFQNTAGSGQLTQLELLFDSTNVPNGKVRLGVYADNNGAPGSLLLDAGEVAAGSGWVAISGLSLPVTQGTYYWLAFNLQNTNALRYQSGQPAKSYYWVGTLYGAMPAQYPAGGAFSTDQYVMRATVSAGMP